MSFETNNLITVGENGWGHANGCTTPNDCVEMMPIVGGVDGGGVQIRDSKLGDESPVLNFDHGEAAAWILAAAQGGFNDLINPERLEEPLRSQFAEWAASVAIPRAVETTTAFV